LGGDAGQLAALLHHGVEVRRGDLGRDGPGDQLGDLGDRLQEVASGFGDQGRIGGDAVDQARVGELAEEVDFGGVEEELHGFTSGLSRPI
jgi:hypothetical protein